MPVFRACTIPLAAVIAATSLWVASSASAATHVVTTTADVSDGTCSVAHCSLREAVSAVNASADTVHVIELPAGTFTLTGAAGDDANASGDLDFSQAWGITLSGAGAGETIIDGGGIDRVLDLHSTSAWIYGLSVRNGAPPSGNGGAIRAVTPGGQSFWFSDGTVTDSSTTGDGGGIWASGGDFRLTDAEVAGNDAAGSGGGIYSTTTSGTVSRATIHANVAAIDGGGLSSSGITSMENTTFHDNTADGRGGAFHKRGGGSTALKFATISANRADADGAGGSSGGAVGVTAGAVTVKNSLVTGNRSGSVPGVDDACSIVAGSVTSNGYNVVTSQVGCAFGGTGDVVVADVLADSFGDHLDWLGNSGIPTLSLQRASPARDAANPSDCEFFEDARGGYRFEDCDSGAYEFGAVYDVAGGIAAPTVGTTGTAVAFTGTARALEYDDVHSALVYARVPAASTGFAVTNANGAACTTASATQIVCEKPLDAGSTMSVEFTVTPAAVGPYLLEVFTNGGGLDEDDNDVTSTVAVTAPTTGGGGTTGGGTTGGSTTGGGTVPTGTTPTGTTPVDPSPTPPVTPDTTAPIVTTTAVRRPADIVRPGTTFSVTSSESAVVSIKVQQLVPGHRVGATCRPGRGPAAARRCTATRTALTITKSVTSTSTTVPLKLRTAPPGPWQLTIVATDAAGNSSVPKVVKFAVPKPTPARRPTR